MGTPSTIQLPADSTGKKLRTLLERVGEDDVHEQIVVLLDPEGSEATRPIAAGIAALLVEIRLLRRDVRSLADPVGAHGEEEDPPDVV